MIVSPDFPRAQTLITWGAVLSLALAGQAAAADVEIDGYTLGKTPCAEAIRLFHAQAREKSKTRTPTEVEQQRMASVIRRILRKAPDDQMPYPELFQEFIDHSEKEDQEQLAQFTPSFEVKGYNCVLPGRDPLGSTVADAFGIFRSGSVDLEAMGVKTCPYAQFFRVGKFLSHPDDPLLCFEGVVGTYGKVVPVEYARVKTELGKKYGKAQELESFPTGTTLDTPETFQLNTQFSIPGGKLLLAGFAQNTGTPVMPEVIRKMLKKEEPVQIKLPKTLKHDEDSHVFYMSEAAHAAVLKNLKTFKSLEAQEEKAKKQQKKAAEDKVLKDL